MKPVPSPADAPRRRDLPAGTRRGAPGRCSRGSWDAGEPRRDGMGYDGMAETWDGGRAKSHTINYGTKWRTTCRMYRRHPFPPSEVG